MGKSFIVRNVVEIRECFFVNGAMACRHTPMVWTSKTHGTANVKNLEKFVVAYIKSLRPGGINEHLYKDSVMPNISSARIVNQRTGDVVEWKAPMFFIID